MRIIKHNEGDNARTFDLDREAWVMMLAFPEDLCSGPIITWAVLGFGILVYWHNTSTLSRVMAKVYLNNDALIPDLVKVNAGLPSKGRSWTVPVFSVKRKTVTEPPKEAAYILQGPFHPRPVDPPHWMGPVPPAPLDATPADSHAEHGSNMVVDNADNAAVDGYVVPEEEGDPPAAEVVEAVTPIHTPLAEHADETDKMEEKVEEIAEPVPPKSTFRSVRGDGTCFACPGGGTDA